MCEAGAKRLGGSLDDVGRRVEIRFAGAKADHVLTDRRRDFRRVHGIERDALLLVRPDGYLGHIATHDLLESTRAAVRNMTPEVAG